MNVVTEYLPVTVWMRSAPTQRARSAATVPKDSYEATACVRRRSRPVSLITHTQTHTQRDLSHVDGPLTADSNVCPSAQVFRRKVCSRISRMMRWRCYSRCSSGWCSALWPRWLLREIWFTRRFSWERWRPWQGTGSLTGATACWTASWRDVKTRPQKRFELFIWQIHVSTRPHALLVRQSRYILSIHL